MKPNVYIETTIPSYLAAWPSRALVMNETIDPIVAEVRKARDAYAKKFNYDIQAMCRDLNNRQSQHPNKIISKPAKKIRATDASSSFTL